MDVGNLAAEFPREAIHWRVQTLTGDGNKALALAYLDARDVMDRLDEVCGPENWQTEYFETPRGRVLCRIGIRIGDDWVWKSDGAGDTAVEGEKGGISDSLKRAAVQWGIGRYLYRLGSVWAPCETYQKNGTTHWKSWKGSPWDHVRSASRLKAAPSPAPFDSAATRDRILKAIRTTTTSQALSKLWNHSMTREAFANMDAPHKGEVTKAHTDQQGKVHDDPALQAPPSDSHEFA